MSQTKLPKINFRRLKLSSAGDARTVQSLMKRIQNGEATGAEIAKFKKLTRGVRC